MSCNGGFPEASSATQSISGSVYIACFRQLLAERATVLRRLNRRGFGYGLKWERWAVDRLDECLARLHEPEFAQHICTDQQTVPQVADTIARIAALSILPDTDGRVRASLRRYTTTLRHVRFGHIRFD